MIYGKNTTPYSKIYRYDPGSKSMDYFDMEIALNNIVTEFEKEIEIYSSRTPTFSAHAFKLICDNG